MKTKCWRLALRAPHACPLWESWALVCREDGGEAVHPDTFIDGHQNGTAKVALTCLVSVNPLQVHRWRWSGGVQNMPPRNAPLWRKDCLGLGATERKQTKGDASAHLPYASPPEGPPPAAPHRTQGTGTLRKHSSPSLSFPPAFTRSPFATPELLTP